MSIVYVESCGDQYDAADAAVLWSDVPASFSLVAGRGGFGRAIRIATGVAGSFKKTVGFDPSYLDTFIVGVAFRASAFSAGANEFLSLTEGGLEQVHFRVNNDGTLGAYRGGGTSNLLGTTTNALSAATWYYIEVKVKAHGSTGTVDIRVSDGSTTSSWLGLTGLNTSATGNNQFNGFAIVGDQAGGGGPTFDFDDLYVMTLNPAGAHAPLGDYRVEYVPVNGAGTVAGGGAVVGAASEHAAVADQPFDGDASYVPFATAGDYSQYAFGALSNPPVAIAAVVPFAVARKDAGALAGVWTGLYDGVTPHFDGYASLDANYVQTAAVFETYPGDSSAWTATNLAFCQVLVQRIDSGSGGIGGI